VLFSVARYSGVLDAPEQILVKAEDGRDALEIAIDGADHASLHMLVEKLKGHSNVFDNYTVTDRIRKLILAEPPPHIADNPAKVILTLKQMRPSLHTPLVAAETCNNPDPNLNESLMWTASVQKPPSDTAKDQQPEQTSLTSVTLTSSQVKPPLD